MCACVSLRRTVNSAASKCQILFGFYSRVEMEFGLCDRPRYYFRDKNSVVLDRFFRAISKSKKVSFCHSVSSTLDCKHANIISIANIKIVPCLRCSKKFRLLHYKFKGNRIIFYILSSISSCKLASMHLGFRDGIVSFSAFTDVSTTVVRDIFRVQVLKRRKKLQITRFDLENRELHLAEAATTPNPNLY